MGTLPGRGSLGYHLRRLRENYVSRKSTTYGDFMARKSLTMVHSSLAMLNPSFKMNETQSHPSRLRARPLGGIPSYLPHNLCKVVIPLWACGAEWSDQPGPTRAQWSDHIGQTSVGRCGGLVRPPGCHPYHPLPLGLADLRLHADPATPRVDRTPRCDCDSRSLSESS